MANKPGKQFEIDLSSSAVRQGIYVYRLKDCPGAWPSQNDNENGKPTSIRFTSNNPFDLLFYHAGNLLLLELKSFAGTSFPYSAIRDHQVTGLSKAAQYPGVIPGVVLNFRKYSRTFFIPIADFVHEMDTGSRKSINLDRASSIGVEIDQQKLLVHYRYDIVKFVGEVAYFETESA